MDVEDAEGLDFGEAFKDRTRGKGRKGTVSNDIKERDGGETQRR